VICGAGADVEVNIRLKTPQPALASPAKPNLGDFVKHARFLLGIRLTKEIPAGLAK
jgi:hypothetical protein